MEDWFENKREDLQEAILNAYKNANDLEQTVEYELQKNLEEIAGRNNNIRDIVFQLINRWAYPGGKLEELFLACYRRRSENPKLRELYQLYLEEKRNREEISSTNGEGDSTPERTVINVNENNSGASEAAIMGLIAQLWSDSAAITNIKLGFTSGFTFKQYSTAYLYGISNA
jgi:hypothetical protein